MTPKSIRFIQILFPFWITSIIRVIKEIVPLTLKADQLHPQDYLHTRHDYRHTNQNLRLVITLLCTKFKGNHTLPSERTKNFKDAFYSFQGCCIRKPRRLTFLCRNRVRRTRFEFVMIEGLITERH